ncbi:DUF4139 domain-containing protein [Geobacter sp. AOG2]|uniref:DUF4139 domain-containing protein n=1 Tax=Geobacter sp. AOG2 TaxID=1566347 RepID=UPI001CC49D12|nr:DUF4139 domain-containing protein [Geobacter sp. AOG2]GFE60236.1 DUF4139 domain-containing protein [Geobacter sp. AOG2]
MAVRWMRTMTMAMALVAAMVSHLWGAGGEGTVTTSTVAEQTGVAVTIYNSNLGLVKDLRTLHLPRGRSQLRFMDVATAIIPASVSIRSLSDAAGLNVLEQNYEYDLLSPQKLMDKYVGKEVKLYQKNPYSEREEVTTATLLSNNNGPVFRIGNEITFGHPGRVIFPELPGSLIASPTLVWLLENGREKPHAVEAAYLTGGIGWHADYVLTLNERDDAADLGGWVTITNNSGATYRDAAVKLVAGDVNRVRDEAQPRLRGKVMLAEAAAPAPQFREEGLLEYHMYTLQHPSTIKDNQSKQISLLSAAGIPVRKELLLSGASYYYQEAYSGDIAKKQKIGVYIELENREKNHLGMPLPRGTVRVYKKDGDKSLQFVGEDAIDHTPRDEKVRIKLGEAFDVVADKRQTDWKKRANDSYEAAYEISIRNHKKEAVVVRVTEPVPGDWQVLDSSHDYVKADSGTLEYKIPVAADGEAKLTYRVLMRY